MVAWNCLTCPENATELRGAGAQPSKGSLEVKVERELETELHSQGGQERPLPWALEEGAKSGKVGARDPWEPWRAVTSRGYGMEKKGRDLGNSRRDASEGLLPCCVWRAGEDSRWS